MNKNVDSTGIPHEAIDKLNNVFVKKRNIKKVLLFGSRVKSTYSSGSDIDIALEGNITYSELMQAMILVDDLNLPYKIDLVLMQNLQNEELIKHIESEGILLYQRVNN